MIAGIDLGTTHSLIGVMEAGIPVLLPGSDGSLLTPSAVYFSGDGTRLVGAPAKRMGTIDPAHAVTSIKRLMGARAGEIDPATYPFGVTAAGDGIRVNARGHDYSPEEISAFILGKLKGDAAAALGGPVDRAVITVPAYFNDAQRAATKRAGELAGLAVERIIGEPTAAALAYGLDRLGDRAKVAVFDLGGGTFDISILSLDRGVFEVLSTNGDTRLGGDDMDAALFAWAVSRIGPPPDATSRALLMEALIATKHRLSSGESAVLHGYFLGAGAAPIELALDRAELDRICLPVIGRARSLCLRSLADAGMAAGDLDEIILVGGATRMPIVRSFVREVFGREPNVSQNPDEAVALGATIQAGILSGAVNEVTLLDVTPLSLGIETFGGLMNVIIPRNTTIPTKRGEMFTNAVAGQRSMRISVLQGEREMARDNWRLGEFDLPFDPLPKGRARVGVQFEIDADGILHVLARDVATGLDKILELRSAVDVSDEAVEKMLEDSLENAFDDMSERVFTETAIRAEEMLPAVALALDRLGDRVSPQERGTIGAQADEVRAALGSREVARLKRAVAALDEATQPLATLLIERALGEAGR